MNIDDFCELLSQRKLGTQYRAIDRAFDYLRSLDFGNDSDRASATGYLPYIFQAVADYATPHIFAYFCKQYAEIFFKTDYKLVESTQELEWVYREEYTEYRELMLAWLNQLLELPVHPNVTKDAVIAAQMFFGVHYTSNSHTWQEVGGLLIEMLDSSDLNLRSCAASKIASFAEGLTCSQQKPFYEDDDDPEDENDREDEDDDEDYLKLYYCDGKYGEPLFYEEYEEKYNGMPPLSELISLIEQKEIEQPGVVAAWYWSGGMRHHHNMGWMLDILERSPEPEPYIPYCPCGLAFVAHETFSDDPVAIRRLIDMGRVGLACAAATDNKYQNEAIEPLLIEIGNDEDPENVRIASWNLAYYYHYLHPRGVAAGYVESIDDLPGVDLYLLFSRCQELESPYAVVIYPKDINETLSGETANYWIDRIFPESVRGAIRIKECDSHISVYRHESGQISYRTGYTWYRSGYVSYQFPKRFEDPTNKSVDIDPYEDKSFIRAADSDKLDSAIVGYRSSVDWNPRQFL